MISIQIDVNDSELRSLLATMDDLAGGGQAFLRSHARDLLEASQASILSGNHVITGRLLLSGRMEVADDGWDVVFGADDPIAGHKTPSEDYASWHETGWQNESTGASFAGHPVITSEVPAIEAQVVRAIEKLLR